MGRMAMWLCGVAWFGCVEPPINPVAPEAAPPDAADPAPVQFRAQVAYGTGAYGPFEIGIGDFDGDALPDLAVVNNEASNLATLRNTGAAAFAPAVVYQSSVYPITIQIADI